MASTIAGLGALSASKVLKTEQVRDLGQFIIRTRVVPGTGPGQSRAEYALLESEDEIGALRQAIAEGMPEFRRGIALGGGSAPVRLSSGGRSVQVTERHARQICEEFLAGRLDQEEMAYLMSALELFPDFEIASEKLAAVIGMLSDPLSDGPLARQRVEGVLRSI